MDFSEFGEPTVPSSSPGSTDSNTGMQPILLPVNPSVFTLAPPMSYPGEGNPHARLNEDVDRHPLSAYPGTDLTTALHNPIAAKYEESPGDLKIVPYKVQNRNTKRESSGGRAFRVNALINDKASSLDDLYREPGIQLAARQKRLVSGMFSDLWGERKGTFRLRCWVPIQYSDNKRCDTSSDPFMPCKRCATVAHACLNWPCTRVSILDLDLHRRGSTRSNDLKTWTLDQKIRYYWNVENGGEALENLQVTITQDQGISFAVTVNQFVPLPGDTTGWKWKDAASQQKVLEMPPFYICNEEEAECNMKNAVTTGKEEYINVLLGDSNPITRKTFEAAFRHLETSESRLILDCLKFWVATRFIEKPWRICSAGLPGFYPSIEPSCPFSGIIPVTPIMDTQIDDMAIKALLDPLGKRILAELNRKILEKTKENWWEIYLATFIIMNNFEFVFNDVRDYTSRHGLRPSTTGAFSLTKGYFHACKTILLYFRFACNGHAPLSLAWQSPKPNSNPKLKPNRGSLSYSASSLDPITYSQQEYLLEIKREIDRQKPSLEAWRGASGSAYQTPLYFSYQILAEDWSPDIHVSEPDDGFTEEDFLTS
ncbi:uncharacterized protein GGS25DRAFT_519082 [Hypoxylon fragiforme]|uniref:uncharacterized protein n=1 Tax=Hypoxylon fragiforme TaxID=63214 RepID=UPI0020C6BDE0|nr:uncharacterized protein GGS25DRAFT_519082 [Hypoxylon fragiforme]KAI2610785.1 hypothetical protein GGS25DRAFT_519082 [Hypoxylon fragiforme]